jgi:hypothetical protein
MSLIPFGFWAASGGGGAASDFELLETQTLTSNETSVIFSSLSAYASDYKHLQIRAILKDDNSGSNGSQYGFTFNGVTTASYSAHRLLAGNFGSTPASSASTSRNNIGVYEGIAGANDSNLFAASVIDIIDPFDSNKNTTARVFDGLVSPTTRVELNSGLFINTAAINSIEIFSILATNLVIGCRLSLYGVRG